MIKKFFTAIILVTGLLGYSPAAFAQDEIVNLNKAGIEELTELFEYLELSSGLAQAIVDYRNANGEFQTPDQMAKVPGMTQDFLEEINPVQKDGDIVYDPDAEPALAPSKC
jgi:competence protein ComEA